jgi:predicted Zn-dependent protease with MMP-like domain
MTCPHDAVAPSLADIGSIARTAFAELPQAIRERCGDLVIAVDEFADDETLDALDIDDPFELTGLYEGTDLRHDPDSGALPPRVVLFRRAILEEWVERGNVTLRELVSHVLVHEVAHHVGLSDEDIAAIDDWTL